MKKLIININNNNCYNIISEGKEIGTIAILSLSSLRNAKGYFAFLVSKICSPFSDDVCLGIKIKKIWQSHLVARDAIKNKKSS